MQVNWDGTRTLSTIYQNIDIMCMTQIGYLFQRKG